MQVDIEVGEEQVDLGFDARDPLGFTISSESSANQYRPEGQCPDDEREKPPADERVDRQAATDQPYNPADTTYPLPEELLHHTPFS